MTDRSEKITQTNKLEIRREKIISRKMMEARIRRYCRWVYAKGTTVVRAHDACDDYKAGRVIFAARSPREIVPSEKRNATLLHGSRK